jgi:hypothetical protein
VYNTCLSPLLLRVLQWSAKNSRRSLALEPSPFPRRPSYFGFPSRLAVLPAALYKLSDFCQNFAIILSQIIQRDPKNGKRSDTIKNSHPAASLQARSNQCNRLHDSEKQNFSQRYS